METRADVPLWLVVACLGLTGPTMADIYVLGRSGDGSSVKYLWHHDNNGEFVNVWPVASGPGLPGAVALGPQGQVYVGWGGTVTQYTPNGEFVRTVVDDARAVMGDAIQHMYVDARGEIYLSPWGYDTDPRSLARYSAEGVLQATYTGITHTGGIAADAAGRVYSTGTVDWDQTFRRWAPAGGEPQLTYEWAYKSSDMGLNPTSSLIYAACDGPRIYVHDLDGVPVGEIPLSASVYRMDYDPLSDSFFTLSVGTHSPQRFAPDGRWLRAYLPPDLCSAFDIAARIPEPATLSLLALGGLVVIRRRRRRRVCV
jgi:hypothetical protein